MTRLLLALTLLVLPMAVSAQAEVAPATSSAPAYVGPKWEYRIETFLAGSVDGIPGMVAKAVLSGPDAQRLEALGKEGWELVSVTGGRAYFKRPLKEPPSRGWWPFW
jgi:hypothetical protein